jgi:catechol-2,3-dioxygenase
MKRLHVHVAVESLSDSINFYSSLFDSKPTVEKEDYAKWMLDDPRVNFAISTRGRVPGLDHLGIQAEDKEELNEIAERLKKADRPVLDEGATTCCYAQGEKSWITDPQGIAWEAFLTVGQSTTYGKDNEISSADVPLHNQSACCVPSFDTVPVEIKRS